MKNSACTLATPTAITVTTTLVTLLLVLAAAQAAHGIDLLQRYPTTLNAGIASANNARQWQFTEADLYVLSRFNFEAGGLRVQSGPADLGIGHCSDGAVWAVVLPRMPGKLTSPAAEGVETVAHIWLRFHPKQISRLFPEQTVSAGSPTNLLSEMRLIASSKFSSSWHAGQNALIPEPKDFTVDVDTGDGVRRFFVVDTEASKADYVPAFENRAVRKAPSLTPAQAQAAFDELWQAFDHDYAMFVLRPEVDWNKLRERYRPRALAARSAYELAGVFAEMLKPLRDLHIWITVAGANVPVFNRSRSANANPAANRGLLGSLSEPSGGVHWAVTADHIGYLAIYQWSGSELPDQCQLALEEMRNTRGLIVDVRLNGGGSEDLARVVAGRFLTREFVYAYSQFRNGPSHSDLTEKIERKVSQCGPWRYNRPVVLLIGQKCMSSNESFIAMMSGDPDLTTMGDHTCGSSGNPRMVELPSGITVSLPRWIDYLPDGTPLDERGFQPQIVFKPKPDAFDGDRDDLLAAALERLRPAPLPEKAIDGPRFGEIAKPTRKQNR